MSVRASTRTGPPASTALSLSAPRNETPDSLTTACFMTMLAGRMNHPWLAFHEPTAASGTTPAATTAAADHRRRAIASATAHPAITNSPS